MKELVSIICPTYNEELFIAACIESILAQDFPIDHIEFLIVDGMSTDETRSIIKQYVLKYSCIQLLDNIYKVTPNALNIGVKNSKGNVIVRIDGHCTYPPNYISTLVRCLFEIGRASCRERV